MSAMILRIKTDNAGTSTSVQFRLPLASTSTYDFTIDWGDTNVETITNASAGFPNITHTYATAGEYDVSITENVVGGFPTIYFNAGGDRKKLHELKQWGTNKWLTFKNSFYFCMFLRITATDEATANTSSVTDFSGAFMYCYSLSSFPLIDTSGGTIFTSAWFNCMSLLSFPLLNMSNATALGQAWFGCSSLESFPLIDTSKVTNIQSAWFGCSSLRSFPLIDTSKVLSAWYAWQACVKLSNFPLINLRKMVNGEAMFNLCTIASQAYSDLLVDIATNGVEINVLFDAGRTQYNSSASAARAILISRGWTIIDQGLYTGVVTISSITPNWGPPAGGNRITITGAGFGATQGTVLIKFVDQTIVSWSDTAITVTVSAGGEGWASIEVENAAGDKQILPATQSYLYTSLFVSVSGSLVGTHDTDAIVAQAQLDNNTPPTNGEYSVVLNESVKVAGVLYNGKRSIETVSTTVM